jgi:hypothetical protein
MTADATDLAQWFAARPSWLQDAARRLFANGDLSADDQKELLALCKREAGALVADFPELKPVPIQAPAFMSADQAKPLSIAAIAKVTGIDALAPRTPLQFAKDGVTIVYGANGSGKSGYIRILKHICGGRGARTLQPNVFAAPPAQQQFTLRYTLDAAQQEKELNWSPGDGAHPDLRHVALYDVDCANVYLTTENVVTYEPPLLKNFSKLSDVSIHIDKTIDAEINANSSRMPGLPAQYTQGPAGQWLSALNHRTPDSELDAHCLWNEQLEQELTALHSRLAEPHAATKAQQLRTAKRHTAELRSTLSTLRSQLNDDAFTTLCIARDTATTKRQAAEIEAKKVFENAPLKGVATDTWRLMWEAARRYATQEAYGVRGFPVVGDDSRCVLRQQTLADDAKQRLTDFEAYVQGVLTAQADAADKAVKDFIASIKEVPPVTDRDKLCDLANIAEPPLRERIREFSKQLESTSAPSPRGARIF